MQFEKNGKALKGNMAHYLSHILSSFLKFYWAFCKNSPQTSYQILKIQKIYIQRQILLQKVFITMTWATRSMAWYNFYHIIDRQNISIILINKTWKHVYRYIRRLKVDFCVYRKITAGFCLEKDSVPISSI